jgi:hypothetical protein
MPLLFVGYALAVWVLAARWRRSAPAFLVVAVGVAGLMLLNWLHYKLNDWTEGDIYLPVLQSIMYPYTGLVAAVGLFIAFIPSRESYECHECGYDLRGRVEGNTICPECGFDSAVRTPRSSRRSGADRPSLAQHDEMTTAESVNAA